MIPNVAMKELAKIAKAQNLSPTQVEEVIKWLSNPTVRPIVPVREFIESPYYMGAIRSDGSSSIYPEVMLEIERMNQPQYSEIVLTGGIGSAKTTCALYTTAYQLYILSCYESPHDLFDLDASSEIVFIFQSLNAKAAKEVDYQRFRSMIEKSPYFNQYFPFDKDLLSELQFPHRIIVRPVSGSESGAIGQNVFGGLIDEVNFMAVVEKSKSSIDGGVYDQATALYNSISKRRKSRFGIMGELPGKLCLVSSRRYPGQFTDVKEADAKREIEQHGKTSIYIYDKRTWDIKPPGSFLKERFKVFKGDDARKPRILEAGEYEKMPEVDQAMVIEIPMDYLVDFERDMISSLRDIAGVATLARHPFIVDREAIDAAFRKDKIIFSRPMVDFVDTRLSIYKKEFYKPEYPRFAHCDLAISGDSAGFAVGTVTGFKQVSTGDGVVELLPEIWVDAVLEIKPPRGKEIQLYKVREIIHALKKLGMNIQWITFDQFQSKDSMQLLKQSGYTVGHQSVDTTTSPYDFTKNAFYDGRISCPYHTKLAFELASLEKDTKKNKIDHPPRGSKDVADALAGIVYGLTMRRELWFLHGVSLSQVPQSIIDSVKKEKLKKEGE